MIAVHLILPELDAPATLCREHSTHFRRRGAQRQILPDGAGAEQSVSHRMFTAELLAIVVPFLVAARGTGPRELTSALGRSSKYLVRWWVRRTRIRATETTTTDSGCGSAPNRNARCDHLGIMAAITGDTVVGSHGGHTHLRVISAALGGSVPRWAPTVLGWSTG